MGAAIAFGCSCVQHSPEPPVDSFPTVSLVHDAKPTQPAPEASQAQVPQAARATPAVPPAPPAPAQAPDKVSPAAPSPAKVATAELAVLQRQCPSAFDFRLQFAVSSHIRMPDCPTLFLGIEKGSKQLVELVASKPEARCRTRIHRCLLQRSRRVSTTRRTSSPRRQRLEPREDVFNLYSSF